jgi:hypothetical protein
MKAKSMVKYTKKVNASIFILCHAYKCNKVTSKWMDLYDRIPLVPYITFVRKYFQKIMKN